MVQWADLSDLNDLFGAIGTTTEDLERAIAAVTVLAAEVLQETTS